MLMEVFKKHNDQMAELVGLEYAPGTLERFQTAYRHTLTFLQWKYKVDDIDISKLDYEFISEYEFWIKSVRKNNHNSTIKYFGDQPVCAAWLAVKGSVCQFQNDLTRS